MDVPEVRTDSEHRRIPMIRFLISTALAVFVLLGAYILEGGSLGPLLGLAAFLITFLVPLFGVLAVWSFGDWLKAWSHAFKPAEGDARRSVEIWKFSELAYNLAGFLGALAGAILILRNIDNPNVMWYNSLAALLVSPLYGTTLAFIARILRSRVEMLNP